MDFPSLSKTFFAEGELAGPHWLARGLAVIGT
jgi:hypothetical protein